MMHSKMYDRIAETLHKNISRHLYDYLFERVVLPACGHVNTDSTPYQYVEDVFDRMRKDSQFDYINALFQIVSAEIQDMVFLAGNNQIRRYGVLMNDERADYPAVMLTNGEAEMIKHWCDNREYWSDRFVGIVEVR